MIKHERCDQTGNNIEVEKPEQRFWIKTHFLYICLSDILFVQPKQTWSRNDVGTLQSTSFMNFPSRIDVLLLSNQFYIVHIRTVLLLGERINITNSELFPNRVPTDFSQIAVQIMVLPDGWPYKFLSKRTTGSSRLNHDFGHLCFGGRIQTSGHSDFWIFNNVGASSILTWV